MLYKFVNGINYLRSFPDEWISNNVIGTGPIQCINCQKYGCIDNIFIGYCANCCQHIYNFERGEGFEVSATELILENNSIFCEYIEREKFNIIAYLENKNKTYNCISGSLFWNCDFCQSINFNNLNYCQTCNKRIVYVMDDNMIIDFNNISIS